MGRPVNTYTCQHDGCRKTGVNPSDFKMVEYRDKIRFSFIVCLEHAKPYERN